MKIIFQRLLTGGAQKSNSVAKRIRISADPSIIYGPSPSGFAKNTGELGEVLWNSHCKEMHLLYIYDSDATNFAEPKLVVIK